MSKQQSNAKMGSTSRLAIIKFFELVIAVVCIYLHYKSRTYHFDADLVSTIAFGGFIVIVLGAFLGHLMRTPINRRIDIFFSLAGCAFFVAAGAFNIHVWQYYSKTESGHYGLAKAALAIINGALFLLDSLLTWRGDF